MISGSLDVQAPSGGTAVLSSGPNESEITLNCSEVSVARDAWQLIRRSGGMDLKLSSLRRLRSPLLQTLSIFVDGQKLLSWSPNKYPRVESLRTLLRVLRG